MNSRFRQAHVSRIPAEIVGREPESTTRLRMILQALAGDIVALSMNPDASGALTEMLDGNGGGFRLGMGDNADGAYLEFRVVGDPTHAMEQIQSLGQMDAEEMGTELPRRLRELGIDPGEVGRVEEIPDDGRPTPWQPAADDWADLWRRRTDLEA